MKTSSSTKVILECIENVIGKSSLSNPISLHEPDFKGTNAWNYVKDCLDSTWVSSSGKWVSRFEKELCECTNAKHAIAVTNGTVGLRLALHLIGVKAQDEVLMPPISFVASANAVSHLNAIPHFVDVEVSSLGLDPKALIKRLEQIAERRQNMVINRETGRRIAAVMVVNVFGHPANTPELKKIATEWGLPLIEDAAEALGSWRSINSEMVHCGLFGSIGILSFNGNKLITTGGGGALITNNDDIASTARYLSTTAKQPHPWDFYHDRVGWNDRLPNINAALGVAQIEKLAEILKRKRNLHKKYVEAFEDIDDIKIMQEVHGCSSNYWLVTLKFCSNDSKDAYHQRNELLTEAHKEGLLLRPIWEPLNQLPMYQNAPSGNLKVALDQSLRLINLPSSPKLLE